MTFKKDFQSGYRNFGPELLKHFCNKKANSLSSSETDTSEGPSSKKNSDLGVWGRFLPNLILFAIIFE